MSPAHQDEVESVGGAGWGRLEASGTIQLEYLAKRIEPQDKEQRAPELSRDKMASGSTMHWEHGPSPSSTRLGDFAAQPAGARQRTAGAQTPPADSREETSGDALNDGDVAMDGDVFNEGDVAMDGDVAMCDSVGDQQNCGRGNHARKRNAEEIERDAMDTGDEGARITEDLHALRESFGARPADVAKVYSPQRVIRLLVKHQGWG